MGILEYILPEFKLLGLSNYINRNPKVESIREWRHTADMCSRRPEYTKTFIHNQIDRDFDNLMDIKKIKADARENRSWKYKFVKYTEAMDDAPLDGKRVLLTGAQVFDDIIIEGEADTQKF